MKSSLSIGSAIFLILGASLVIPKIADAALTFNHKDKNHTAQNKLGEHKKYPQKLSNGYEPPDFGRPSGPYGSGTR